ncbi:hypothetical protein ACFL47_10630, partial [Candidatus Latescibacterota bacterium]
RYGKPVYPFIWPEYHPSNSQRTGTDVTGPYWRRQLVWGGWQRDWEDDAPWWIATKEFLAELAGPTSVDE